VIAGGIYRHRYDELIIRSHRSRRIIGPLAIVYLPEISVTGNAVNIADGDATPSLADHTDFGTITQGGATVSRTYTANNLGATALGISGVTAPTGFTITTSLPASILPGASAPLIVRLDATLAGVKSGDIVISSNDLDEGTFNFAVTGTVTASATGRVAYNKLGAKFRSK
jgi:hypothetical protein